MRQEDIQRMLQRNREETWRAINEINRRLEYIEPRERSNNPLLAPPGATLAYGEIYAYNNGVAQSIPSGAAFTKSTAFGSNGLSVNSTPDAANDKITITRTGVYKVSCAISAMSGTVNINLFGAIFLGGVEQQQIEFKRKIATANDVGSMSLSGLIDAQTQPIDVDLRIKHDNGAAVNITIAYVNLTIVYIGST